MIEPTIKINSTGSTLDSKGSEATAMWKENLYTLAGIAIGMGIICFTSYYFQVLFLIPSLASSAIMLFMSYNNVFAQPRNVMGGHFVSD
ncbi:MAG: HPP family protein [Syntrophomonadaceae bacterium]|jgi:CBS-domain-containing membrane protein